MLGSRTGRLLYWRAQVDDRQDNMQSMLMSLRRVWSFHADITIYKHHTKVFDHGNTWNNATIIFGSTMSRNEDAIRRLQPAPIFSPGPTFSTGSTAGQLNSYRTIRTRESGLTSSRSVQAAVAFDVRMYSIMTKGPAPHSGTRCRICSAAPYFRPTVNDRVRPISLSILINLPAPVLLSCLIVC
jgi:hypothetical protein